MQRKRLILLIVVVPILLNLSSCATAQGSATSQAGQSQPAGTITYVAPNQDLSTPVVGSVTVLALVQGARGVFLRSLPDHTSAIAGEVQPGDTGTLLGIDSSGTWLLVKINNQTGWLPIQLLDYTISQ